MRRLRLTIVACALTAGTSLACSDDSKSEGEGDGSGGSSGGGAASGGASPGDSGSGGASAGSASSGGSSAGGSEATGGSSSGGASLGDSGSGGASPAPEGGTGDVLGSCTGVSTGICSEYVYDDESTVPRQDQHDLAEGGCGAGGGTWSESGCTTADLLGWCERTGPGSFNQYYYPSSGQLAVVLEAACNAQQGTWHAP